MSYTKDTKDGPQTINIYENTCRIKAGQKRKETAIYELDCKALIRDGYYFYCDVNNTFIVNEVPKDYLRKIW
ncbi:MAG: hypothetical protein K6F45_00155 [Saccharofermentans sp.]|nr:hypothetical protein [Saccharofermentans sp.]